MKIYDYTVAPNPRRVRIFLAEKGIDMEYEQVDIPKAENRTPEFLRDINQMGGLPVLELDDGSHIAESVAICRYFEELQPDPPLFGTDARDRANVEMWQRRMEQTLVSHAGNAFQHSFEGFADRVEQIPEWADQNRRRLAERFEWLDGVLADREFVAGDRFSIADITALCGVDFAKVSKIRMDPDAQKNLARWYEAVSSRPSAKA